MGHGLFLYVKNLIYSHANLINYINYLTKFLNYKYQPFYFILDLNFDLFREMIFIYIFYYVVN